MGLVGVIFIIILFSMFLVSMSTYLITNQKMNALNAIKKKTFYLSESGIEFAIRKSIDSLLMIDCSHIPTKSNRIF